MDNKKPEKQDRRIRKTRKLLLQGLTQLMSKKSLKHITVRELTDICDLNRATFYLHYNDIYDMVETIENEMLLSFNTAVNKYSAEELKKNPSLIFIEIFEFIYENRDMCKVLLGENGDYAFVEKLKGIIKNKTLDDWLEVYKAENHNIYDICYEYIVSGCIGAIKQWINTNFAIPVEKMAMNVANMTLYGITFIIQIPS